MEAHVKMRVKPGSGVPVPTRLKEAADVASTKEDSNTKGEREEPEIDVVGLDFCSGSEFATVENAYGIRSTVLSSVRMFGP
jgi:hypothetical protein